MRAPVILAALVAMPALAAQGQRDPHIAAIDAYAAKARAEWNAPALAIAIVKNDSVIFAKGYGVLEKGGSKAADENTLFAIGSSTKAFNTAALAMLVDEGKVKWDDHAVDYLPGWQLSDPWMTREIRIRDLVTHRVGLERADYIWEGTDNLSGRIADAYGATESDGAPRGRFDVAVDWDESRQRILCPCLRVLAGLP